MRGTHSLGPPQTSVVDRVTSRLAASNTAPHRGQLIVVTRVLPFVVMEEARKLVDRRGLGRCRISASLPGMRTNRTRMVGRGEAPRLERGEASLGTVRVPWDASPSSRATLCGGVTRQDNSASKCRTKSLAISTQMTVLERQRRAWWLPLVPAPGTSLSSSGVVLRLRGPLHRESRRCRRRRQG